MKAVQTEPAKTPPPLVLLLPRDGPRRENVGDAVRRRRGGARAPGRARARRRREGGGRGTGAAPQFELEARANSKLELSSISDLERRKAGTISDIAEASDLIVSQLTHEI